MYELLANADNLQCVVFQFAVCEAVAAESIQRFFSLSLLRNIVVLIVLVLLFVVDALQWFLGNRRLGATLKSWSDYWVEDRCGGDRRWRWSLMWRLRWSRATTATTMIITVILPIKIECVFLLVSIIKRVLTTRCVYCDIIITIMPCVVREISSTIFIGGFYNVLCTLSISSLVLIWSCL